MANGQTGRGEVAYPPSGGGWCVLSSSNCWIGKNTPQQYLTRSDLLLKLPDEHWAGCPVQPTPHCQSAMREGVLLVSSSRGTPGRAESPTPESP